MSGSADFYEHETCRWVDEVKAAELDSVDYNTAVYETEKFHVTPTIALTLAGEPVVKYGIYNKDTNVMEAEASQLITAKGWATALTESLMDPDQSGVRKDLPGLSLVKDDDDPKVH